MKRHPAVIIHGLPDARAALAHGKPVLFLSAPGAASYAGCLWWWHLMQAAEVTGLSLLDCADAPGRAVEALRLGLPGVVLAAAVPAFGQVAALAAQAGALLLDQAPPALDLANPGAARHLASWLAG